MRFHIAMDDVPERQRLEAWVATLHGMLGMQVRTSPDASKPFRAHLSCRSSGALFNVNVAADTHRVMRQPRDIAHRPWDCYWIYCEASAGAWFRAGNEEFVTHPGGIFIGDADTPFETEASDRFTHQAFVIPKALLDPHLPALGRPLSMNLSGRSGVDALAASYLDSLARNWDSIPEATMGPVADTLARLIGIACGTAAGALPEAVRAGRLTQAKRHIDRHLADPALSPSGVAAALGISVRALHLLFEPTGSSFARHVLRRRLEECRAALLINPTRAVTDIAFAWGFNNLSTFYRAFQAAFGLSPGEVRAASRDAPHF
jgi:AraC-like DNA-binding protein